MNAPCFDVLDLHVSIDGGGEPITRYIDELLRPFSAASATHCYEILQRDDDEAWFALEFDGDLVTLAPTPEALVSPLIHNLNWRAVSACRHLVLHAGGVEREGVGVALPGQMESGKTTLTAGLVRAGFSYLTDEAVAIDRETLEVQPYPKPLSIDRGAWPLFPELEPHADLASDAYKSEQWQVPPSAIGGSTIGNPCPIGLIVFPQYSRGARITLEPMRRAEALVELTTNTFSFDAQARGALDLLAEVVRAADCYRLTTGDLGGSVAAVEGLVGAPRTTEPAR